MEQNQNINHLFHATLKEKIDVYLELYDQNEFLSTEQLSSLFTPETLLKTKTQDVSPFLYYEIELLRNITALVLKQEEKQKENLFKYHLIAYYSFTKNIEPSLVALCLKESVKIFQNSLITYGVDCIITTLELRNSNKSIYSQENYPLKTFHLPHYHSFLLSQRKLEEPHLKKLWADAVQKSCPNGITGLASNISLHAVKDKEHATGLVKYITKQTLAINAISNLFFTDELPLLYVLGNHKLVEIYNSAKLLLQNLLLEIDNSRQQSIYKTNLANNSFEATTTLPRYRVAEKLHSSFRLSIEKSNKDLFKRFVRVYNEQFLKSIINRGVSLFEPLHIATPQKFIACLENFIDYPQNAEKLYRSYLDCYLRYALRNRHHLNISRYTILNDLGKIYVRIFLGLLEEVANEGTPLLVFGMQKDEMISFVNGLRLTFSQSEDSTAILFSQPFFELFLTIEGFLCGITYNPC